MRVLLANKFLYPRGGSERAVLELGRGLEAQGHDVFWFGMDHADNVVDAARSACVPRRDYRGSGRRRYGDALHMVYSTGARRTFARFLARVRPDVVHAHNIYHQLTPSILDAAHEAGIPVVMTLHDYKLVCPRYDLLRHGQLCDACVETGPTACLRHRCAGDWAGSLLLTVEALVHRQRRSYDRVRRFFTPSHFLRQVMVRGGWPAERLQHLSNFCPAFAAAGDSGTAPEPERFLYAGRLSQEKGIGTLLRAVGRLSHGKLVVCGTGPLQEDVQRASQRSGGARVEWTGHLAPAALAQQIQRARFVVLPSECFENAPFAVLEAMAMGRAVIASDIGGVPELVMPGRNGSLVRAGDVDAWEQALRSALQQPERIIDQGAEGRRMAQERFGFDQHLQRVYAAYLEVLA